MGKTSYDLDNEEHDADASAKRVVQGLSLPTHDYEEYTYPDSTTTVLTCKQGGASGTTVATLTIIYTDSTKEDVSSVTKT